MSLKIRLSMASVVILFVGTGVASLSHLTPPPIAVKLNEPSPELPRLPGKPPQFAVSLNADKSSYIQREPIRLSATIRNVGAEDFTVTHVLGERAAKVEFQRIDDGVPKRLDESPLRVEVRCGNVAPTALLNWTIAKAATLSPSYWDENLYVPGIVTFRAVVTIQNGAYKGTRIVTNDLLVAIAKPEGADGKAFELMSFKDFVPTGDARGYSMDFLGHGLVPGRPGHLAKPLLDLFLSKHGDSLYAQYIRFNQGCTSIGESPDAYAKTFEDLLKNAPPSFPLRMRGQLFLLQHYLGRSELRKAAEVAKAVRVMPSESANPEEAAQLEHLLQQVGPKPATTPEEHEMLRGADLTVRVRAIAENHWLVKALTDSLGRCQLASSTTDNVNLSFFDSKSPFGLTLDFTFTDGGLGELGLRGPLSSFCVGRLYEPLARLQKQHHLSREEALKSHFWATVNDKSIEGRLTLPSQEQVAFSVPGEFLE